MTTPREKMLMDEIEKRDRIIAGFRRGARAAGDVPGNVQGELVLSRYPITEFAMTIGRDLELPETLADIADVIGREGALMLSEAYLNKQTGNRSWRAMIYIPQRRLGDDHPLVLILNRERAEQLQKTHANIIIELPRCADIQTAYRDHVARVMLAGGHPPEHVAGCGAVTLDRARTLEKEALTSPHHTLRLNGSFRGGKA